MRTITLTFPAVLAIAACVCGCSKEKKAIVGSQNYWELPADAVVLKVNGHELTKGEQERNLDLQEGLAMIANPKMSERQRKSMRMKMLKACEAMFIQKTVVNDWGRTNGVELTDREREFARLDFARRLTKGRLAYENVASRLRKDLAAELDGYVDGQQYNKKCVEELEKRNLMPIAADEVEKRRKYFKEYNKDVMATNALTWAAASNLWKRIQKDPTVFNDEVMKYQQNEVEHISSEPDMGAVGLSFFEDGDPTWKADLLKAKDGDVLRPRIGDNGLLMVKVVECLPPDEQQEPKEPKWRLAKIFWELGEEWEPQTDAELKADIEKIHAREARERGYKALLSGIQVSYPSGTNLLHRAKKERGPLSRKNPQGHTLPEKIRQLATERGANI